MVKDSRSGSRSTDQLKKKLAVLGAENKNLKRSLDEMNRVLAQLKEAEQALRLSEEKFRLLFQNANDEVLHLDRDGMVIDVNENVEKLFGYRREEVMGRNISEFPVFNPGTKKEMLDLFQGVLDNGGSPFIKVEVRHKDGHPIWVEPTGTVLTKDGKVEGILVFLKDVTERKRWEDQIEELYRQEKQLREQIEEEMQHRVEFTRMLAHELKTPLTSVVTSSDSLMAELEDEHLLGLARNIGRGAASLTRRVNELLDLAKGEVGILEMNPETIDLLAMLQESVDSISPVAISQGQRIVPELPPSLPQVEADLARIQQVVINLLDNALKFTPRGGEIRLRASQRGNDLVIEVQDTGPGMSRQEQERVFEPYHRLASDKGRLGGLGLGLALCRRLVELHGGQIWVRSLPGKGATFGFSLPLRLGDVLRADSQRISRLWKVLIIEDDPEIVDSVALAFHKDWPEAELISARMGEEGIFLVESEKVDVVILDLSLPDIDGLEVLERIRLFSAVPIVIVTVRDDETDITRGLNLGADDYVTKPFRKKELLARLQVQLRKRAFSGEYTPVTCGLLHLDPSSFQLTYGGREISLTTVEGRILHCLMRNWGRVVPHMRLAEEVWGEDYPGAVVSLRTHIRSLRNKIEGDPSHPVLILTKAGVGYSLARQK